MGKHHALFAVMVRPNFSSPEVMHAMPFVDEEFAEGIRDDVYRAGNYSARVARINPATGREIVAPVLVELANAQGVSHNYEAPSEYLTHPPLI